jgi:hypothetical protein
VSNRHCRVPSYLVVDHAGYPKHERCQKTESRRYHLTWVLDVPIPCGGLDLWLRFWRLAPAPRQRRGVLYAPLRASRCTGTPSRKDLLWSIEFAKHGQGGAVWRASTCSSRYFAFAQRQQTHHLGPALNPKPRSRASSIDSTIAAGRGDAAAETCCPVLVTGSSALRATRIIRLR